MNTPTLTAEAERTDAIYQRACELEHELRAEVERLKTCGIVEIAASNPSVIDYCKHWEGRAERAEAAETVALANWNGALERAMKAEADLAALEQCHDDNCRAVVRLDAELAKERARLDHVLKTDWPFHDREEIDAAMQEGAK